MGKSTISMAIFNSFLYVYQRVAEISSSTVVWGAFIAKHGTTGSDGCWAKHRFARSFWVDDDLGAKEWGFCWFNQQLNLDFFLI